MEIWDDESCFHTYENSDGMIAWEGNNQTTKYPTNAMYKQQKVIKRKKLSKSSTIRIISTHTTWKDSTKVAEGTFFNFNLYEFCISISSSLSLFSSPNLMILGWAVAVLWISAFIFFVWQIKFRFYDFNHRGLVLAGKI
jgi:hypothetical protein